MAVPPEAFAAKEALEDLLFASGLVTGVSIGVRDEENPDPDDWALRIFVTDDSGFAIAGLRAVVQFFQGEVVFIRRAFRPSGALPDDNRYRPLEGGTSVGSKRLAIGGTLGAIMRDPLDADSRYGISNHHVLCSDMARAIGDVIVQPTAGILGSFQVDEIGPLVGWDFPETTEVGTLDAAVCRIDLQSADSIVDIGPVSGSAEPTLAMQITKRGRTTGQTFGWIEDVDATFLADYPDLPAIINAQGAQTITRKLRHQIQLHVDFPLSVVIGDQGDSGSAVVSGTSVVGLYWGSGYDPLSPGNPIMHGCANKATEVERVLGYNF